MALILSEVLSVWHCFFLLQAALREELTERASRSAEIESRLEEVVAKESQLRSNNKVSDPL